MAGCVVLLQSLCTLAGCQTAGLKPQEKKSVTAVPLRSFLHFLGEPNGRIEPPRKEECGSVAAVLCCCGACAPLKAAKRQA